MTKIIGLCDCTKDGDKASLASRLSVHLDNHFGKSKVLSRRKSRPSRTRATMHANSFTSCLEDGGYSRTKAHFAISKPIRRSKPIILRTTASENATFDWLSVSKTLGFSKSFAIDFILIETDFDQSFLAEAKVSSVNDLIVVLDHCVIQDSESLQFVKSAVEQIEDCRIGIIVDTGSCLWEAWDVYSHFKVILGSAQSGSISFLGHLPQTKNKQKYDTLEIMALQNIALGLLDLKYEANPHSIPSEMFEGFLH
jgi:hypothetical protein